MEGMKDPGLFLIRADLTDPAYHDTVLQIIYSELDRVKEEGVEEQELTPVVNSLKAEQIYRLNRPSRFVGTLGYYQLAGGDYKMMNTYYERLSELRPTDIQQAAKKYLQKKNRNVVGLMPKAASEGGS